MATIEEIKISIEQQKLKLDWIDRYIKIGDDLEEVDRLVSNMEKDESPETLFGYNKDYFKATLIDVSFHLFFSLNIQEMKQLKRDLETFTMTIKERFDLKAQELHQEGIDNGYINS